MVANRKVTGTSSTMLVGLATGVGGSLVITAAGSGLLAWLILGQKMPQSATGYGVMLLLLLASACGAWIAYRKIQRRRMLICGLSGVCYFVCLLACTALFFGGEYEAVGVTALVVLAGCLSVGLLGLAGKSRRGYGKKWRR